MSDWTPSFPDLPVLDDLGAQLVSAAAATERSSRPAPRRARGARRRSLRLAFVACASVVTLAAAAYAATKLIATGEKVLPSRGVPKSAPTGRDDAATSRLLPLRVADPDGGPPWGIRVFRMPHHLMCVQVARIVDGRLGVLGRDGAFGNDGRFHELPAQGALALKCGHLDGADRLFLDGFDGPAVASGDNGYLSPPTAGHSSVPRADRRTVVWGFAGPKATRVAITAPRVRRTLRPRAHDDWAYLFVLRGSREQHRPLRRATTYVGGLTCAIEPGRRTALACAPPPGFER
jgi:hypothetical protein